MIKKAIEKVKRIGYIKYGGIPQETLLPKGLANNDLEWYNEDCDHDWKLYVGFNESYYYCTKCNLIREVE